MSESFQCPRCHGVYGGADLRVLPDGRAEITGYRCNCNEDGESYSGHVAPGAPPLRSYKPCGWKGAAGECLTG